MAHNKYAGIDPHIVTVIAREVRNLVGRYGLFEADIPDIEQDLHLKVWTELKKLRAAVVVEAAVNRIVDSKIKDILRSRKCMCRDWRCEVFSINAPRRDAEDDALTHELYVEDMWCESFGLPPFWHECREMEADLASDLANLPVDLQEFVKAFGAADANLSKAARMMGVSRKKARLLLLRLKHELGLLRGI